MTFNNLPIIAWFKSTSKTCTDTGICNPRTSRQHAHPEQETREKELLDQFYSTLDAMYLAAEPFPGEDAPTTQQHKRIYQLLEIEESSRRWRDAYKIEQLLISVMTDKQVTAELPRRLAEAKARELKFVEEIEKQIEGAKDNTDMRCIFHRLLNDLQWFYNKRDRRVCEGKQLSRRVSILFFIAFASFLILLFIPLFTPLFIKYHLNPIGFLTAMSTGFLGATFSMLIKNQQRISEGSLEDLNVALAWNTLLVRSFVGLGAAVILYFFFESGLLTGTIWPKVQELAPKEVKPLSSALVPNQQWYLLVIWCFLAGFSETLVPNILQKTERKAS